MGLAPDPRVPERVGTNYESVVAPNAPGQRGPLRFEEGVATDTDVPSDFVRGLREGAIPAPGRSNHVNPATLFKHADETMSERAHVGSAAWPDAPTFVSEFAHGSMTNYAEQKYEQVRRSGGRQERRGAAVVND